MTFIGILGSLLLLVAFSMLETHRWTEEDLVYDLLNMIGGGMMVAYALSVEAYPFVLLNSIWTIVALRDVVKFFLK